MKQMAIYFGLALLLVGMVAATGNNNNGQNHNWNNWHWFSWNNHNNNNPSHGGTGSGGGSICKDNGFNCECQNFYKDTHYYAMSKWEYTCSAKDYTEVASNPLYGALDYNVDGTLKKISWTSNPEVYSVLVKAGNDYTEYVGGSGSATSSKDISHVTFCGYKTSNGGGGPGNGVPEFSPVTLGIAMTLTTLGILYLRKSE
jgi:hypothetical protein